VITSEVRFTDAVLEQAVIFPGDGEPPATRTHMRATFTSAVAAALGLQHLKDVSDDAKAVPLKTVCKSFRARATVNGLPFDLTVEGHEVKQFRLVFPEKEQPRIHFCLYSTDKGKQWSEYAAAVGQHPAELVLTPLQGDLSQESHDADADRVYPQKELDGSYPFALAQRREYSTAKAGAVLYVLEAGLDEWLFGWEYRYLTAAGREKIRERIDPPSESSDYAFTAAAFDLANFLENNLVTATKKEREQIDAICEWLQPIIDGEPEPDIAEAVAEAMEAEGE
jgi:hypothetical protein